MGTFPKWAGQFAVLTVVILTPAQASGFEYEDAGVDPLDREPEDWSPPLLMTNTWEGRSVRAWVELIRAVLVGMLREADR